MGPNIPDPEDPTPYPVDSGEYVGCMAEGCGGTAALMWMDQWESWISVLCAEHARESPPGMLDVAKPVFFDSCPADVRDLAEGRVRMLGPADTDEAIR